MTNVITITSIENAINIWRNVEGDNLCLGANARCLADIYGLMIYEGATEIDVAGLTERQKECLEQSTQISKTILGR